MFKFYYMKGSGVFSLSFNNWLYFHLFITHEEDSFFGYQKFYDDDGYYGTFGLSRLALVCWRRK